MKIHQLNGYISSLYLVEYTDKLLLMDSGCPTDVDMVKEFISCQLRRPLEQLKLVVVTHMHPDHGGGAYYYQNRLRVPVATMAMDTQWYRGVKGSLQHLIDIFLTYYVARRSGKDWQPLWYPKNLYPDIFLTGNQALPGFEDWQVVSTPGHTDRDISLYHNDSRVIYLADVMIKVKNQFRAPIPVTLPGVYQRTLEYLAQLDPHEVLMAHGGRSPVSKEVFLNVSRMGYMSPKESEVVLNIVKGYIRKLLANKN